MPSPHSPRALEERIRSLLMEFHPEARASGESAEEATRRFLSGLPRHRVGGFGGNTPCISVESQSGASIIIDGGSGLRELGYSLMNGPCGRGQGEVHLYFTHFHWDHLIGLPFFTPLFVPGNRIHFYAVQPELEDVFRILFKKPYFPVPLESLGSKIEYHRIAPREPRMHGDLKITPYQLDHPDPCWGYRIEADGRAVAYCVDTECTRVTREQLGPDLPLYQGVDVMIFDAQYTLLETIEKVNWGHAAASLGIDIAAREGVKRVFFMHHDPASSDEKISAAEAQARRYYDTQVKSARGEGRTLGIEWSFLAEGQIIEV